jgi:hypothetical protein
MTRAEKIELLVRVDAEQIMANPWESEKMLTSMLFHGFPGFRAYTDEQLDEALKRRCLDPIEAEE